MKPWSIGFKSSGLVNKKSSRLPMAGSLLTDSLRKLVEEFDQIAMPDYGKFVEKSIEWWNGIDSWKCIGKTGKKVFDIYSNFFCSVKGGKCNNMNLEIVLTSESDVSTIFLNFKLMFITCVPFVWMMMMTVKATRENDCGYVDKLLIGGQANFFPIYE